MSVNSIIKLFTLFSKTVCHGRLLFYFIVWSLKGQDNAKYFW